MSTVYMNYHVYVVLYRSTTILYIIVYCGYIEKFDDEQNPSSSSEVFFSSAKMAGFTDEASPWHQQGALLNGMAQRQLEQDSTWGNNLVREKLWRFEILLVTDVTNIYEYKYEVEL